MHLCESSVLGTGREKAPVSTAPGSWLEWFTFQ